MRVVIAKGKASSILFDGKFYDTGVPINVDFSTAMRLANYTHCDVQWEYSPYDPELIKEGKINFAANIDMTSGFGGVSYHLVRDAKFQTALAGRLFSVRDPLVEMAAMREINPGAAMVWHDQPRELWLYSPFKKNIAIVPFETTRIPRSWVGKLNGFDGLLVPCKQNIEAFRESGVKIPIELIHWGVDPNQFYPIERPYHPIFTFGTMGKLTTRKGIDLLIEAFLEAFPRTPDVRLICKTSDNVFPWGVKDGRLKVFVGEMSHEDIMKDFYKELDCFVFPTRGEGFGLTPLEAMATGVPAIVTGWAGPMEYMTPEVGWTIDYSMVPAKIFTDKVYKEDCGDWSEPNKAHLIHLMRYAYEHRDEVKQKGAAAAAHVAQNWLWSDKIKMYEDALEGLL